MTTTPLPILATVHRAYSDVWAGREMLVRAAAFWLAIVLLLDGASLFLGFSGEPVDADNPAGSGFLLGALLALASTFVAVIGIAAVMVVWHRRVLAGEVLTGPLAPIRRETVWYLLLEIGITMLGAIAAGLGSAVSMMLGPLAPIGIMISVLAGVFLMIRLTLVLPAAAIGDREMTLKRSWQLTKDHWLRLFAGSMLAAIPIVVAAAVVQSLLALLGGTGSLIGEFVSLVGGVIQATVGAAYLSFCYIHITNGPAGTPALS